MSILSTACKKHEFVPFTKDGHTLFVKFTIDMEEKGNSGSVATFVIRLLVEGYWTLFVHGKKLQKSHRIYPRFSCVNTLASSSKNYKLDIAKVDELFGYLNSCIFCVGHPELYHLSREANRSDPEGLTIIPLSNDAEAVEVLRNVRWEGKNYPSTLVHKNCELIKSLADAASTPIPIPGFDPAWFRCRPCEEISQVLSDMNAKSIETFIKKNSASVQPPDLENIASTANGGLPASSRQRSPSIPSMPSAPVQNGTAATHSNIDPGPFLNPPPNGPTFLLARNEEDRHYVLLSASGDYYCGMCFPTQFRFPQQQEAVSFNEHLWMKHHVFIDSISIWCDICHKPFFDRGRFRMHVQRDHAGQA